jgi:hypothetical protein
MDGKCKTKEFAGKSVSQNNHFHSQHLHLRPASHGYEGRRKKRIV